MNHDPLCGLSEPCDEEEPEHGYCSMQRGTFCILCQQWCICDRLAKARADERETAAQRVESCVNKYKPRDYNDAVNACAAAVRGVS